MEPLSSSGLLIIKPRFFGLYQVASKTGVHWVIFFFTTHLPLSFRVIFFFKDEYIDHDFKKLRV